MILTIDDFSFVSNFITSTEQFNQILAIPSVKRFVDDCINTFNLQFSDSKAGVSYSDSQRFVLNGSDVEFDVDIDVITDGSHGTASLRIICDFEKEDV